MEPKQSEVQRSQIHFDFTSRRQKKEERNPTHIVTHLQARLPVLNLLREADTHNQSLQKRCKRPKGAQE